MARTQTSPLGNRPDVARARRRAAGFTLLELLVVLVILALAAAVVAPIIGSDTTLAHKRDTLAMASLLREARTRASITLQETRVVFDLAERRYEIEDHSDELTFPASADVTLETAEQESDGERRAIRFYPGGGSTGGSVELAFPEETYRIEVDWLTGRVIVDDPRS